jgi:pimeloyl-ACP methyl ester carboxylesterase
VASVLLIHGAWHGGWCFERLVPLLGARGHIVAAPTLPGMGGSAAQVAAVTLEGWADFVVEQARALPGPVILVGHSRGGIVASTAAERDPDAFSALVYLAAFMLPSGTSLIEARDAMVRNADFDAGLSTAARGAALAVSREAAIGAFYSDCSAEDQAQAVARIVPEPVAPLNTPLALTAGRFGSLPRHYIECTLDRTIPIAQQRAMQAALPCASVTTLESGHSPFLSMPDRLADVLDQLARGTER